MTMSSFRVQPRVGHLDRLKRMFGYLCKFRHYKIRFRTEEPDFSAVPCVEYDWSNTTYGNGEEDLPKDAPPPLGKRVVLTHYFDANLMHDVLSGKAVTGIFHLMNKTPMMWFSKKQATSETATYGSEFIACRTCLEQIIDIRNSFRYLGVEVYSKSYVFGDNAAQINSAKVPQAKLNKRHNILSFHFVRDMISKGFILLSHIPSEFNAADIMTKQWKYQASYLHLLKPFLNHEGNVGDLFENDDCYGEFPESSFTCNSVLNVTVGENEEIQTHAIEIGNY